MTSPWRTCPACGAARTFRRVRVRVKGGTDGAIDSAHACGAGDVGPDQVAGGVKEMPASWWRPGAGTVGCNGEGGAMETELTEAEVMADAAIALHLDGCATCREGGAPQCRDYMGLLDEWYGCLTPERRRELGGELQERMREAEVALDERAADRVQETIGEESRS